MAEADKTAGVYRKYEVKRTDGSSEPGGRHERCRYFVLDLDHDPHAAAALRAYAESCQGDYPALASDLSYAAEQIDSHHDLDHSGIDESVDLGFTQDHLWGSPRLFGD